MNKYEETLLGVLSYKYPGYLIDVEEYSSMLIVLIKNRSSGFVVREKITKYKDVSLIMHEMERIIKEMREEELKSVAGLYNKNLIDTNSYLEIRPMPINRYSIAPKEIIFQDEKTTIINWNDHTKTIVKCSDDDVFSPEAGVALCYMKKFITDNDSERFHRILKSLISVSKFKNSNQEEKSSGFDKENLERQARNMLPIDLGAMYLELQKFKKALNNLHTTEENHDIDTGTPDNSGDNDTDGSAVEVES